MAIFSPSIQESGWDRYLGDEVGKPYFRDLTKFLREEVDAGIEIRPDPQHTFRALNTVDYDQVRVVILGQDPYPGAGHANGLAFAVNEGVTVPGSLRNIFKEINDDLQTNLSFDRTLLPWAKQGILLLNTVLTTRIGQPQSHQGRGWEIFTDRIISCLSDRQDPIVFLLWGASAQHKASIIKNPIHHTLKATHPSPLSAHRGFLGCKHFSQTNQLLTQYGKDPIQWGQ